MKKYNVNELYKKKWLNLDEVAFLVGGISRGNVYIKMRNGQLPFKYKTNSRNKDVARIDSKDVYDYVLRRRNQLMLSINRLPLPTTEIDWESREE